MSVPDTSSRDLDQSLENKCFFFLKIQVQIFGAYFVIELATQGKTSIWSFRYGPKTQAPSKQALRPSNPRGKMDLNWEWEKEESIDHLSKFTDPLHEKSTKKKAILKTRPFSIMVWIWSTWFDGACLLSISAELWLAMIYEVRVGTRKTAKNPTNATGPAVLTLGTPLLQHQQERRGRCY